MKKKIGKLSLSRETVRVLSGSELEYAAGAGILSANPPCDPGPKTSLCTSQCPTNETCEFGGCPSPTALCTSPGKPC